MIPLGTGLFKTIYDSKKHNDHFAKNTKYQTNSNIVEQKLKDGAGTNDHLSEIDIGNTLKFNITDLIK